MRLSVAAAVVCLSIVGLSSADDVRAAIRKPTNIPAEGLVPALKQLAHERGLQVVFQSEIVGTTQTHGAVGELTTQEALKQLLEGTNLIYRFLDDKTITILPASSAEGSGASPVQPSSAPPPTSGSPKEAANSGAFLLAQAASGQGASTGPVEAQAKRAETGEAPLQEVIVTARKREERLIDTPQSVSVLSADALARLDATQFRDFANTVPGLSYQTAGAGTTQVTLRGVTTGFDVGPTVGIYVDEVPYGSSTAFAQGAQVALDVGLFDLDRIEVLRGPQGTLYGASTMGGLIKYVTRRPDTAAFSGSAQAGISDTQEGTLNYNADLALNTPIVPGMAGVRTSVYYSRDGGYIDNAERGEEDVNRSNIYGGRIDFLLTPTDALSVRVTGFLQNISRDGEATANYTLTGAMPYGALGQFRPFAEPFQQQFRLVSGTVSYDAGPATLTSISSYQTTKLATDWDVSLVYVPLLNGFGFGPYSAVSDLDNSSTDKFTQEVRLAPDKNGPIAWVIGGFYTHETSHYAEAFVLRDLAGNPAPNNLYTFSAPSTYEEYAAFGDLTWHLTDKWDVTGGLRAAHNDQEYTQFGSGLFIASRPPASSSASIVTYLANGLYKFNDHATAYLRYATGYRPGGPNISANDPATGLPLGPPAFAADRLKSYEAGLKAETDDRRYALDVAAYYIDWTDIAILTIRGGFALRENVPDGARIRGTELTLSARPVNQFTLSSRLAYQDAKLAQTDQDLGAADGERLPNVPRFTGSLNADYQLIEGGWQPTVGAMVRYVSDRMVSFNGNPSQYRLPSYTAADLRMSFLVSSVHVQLYVHNLFDERGQLSNMLPQFGNRIGILEPRTAGVTLTTNF